MTAPTLEQKQASDPAASAWVAASAGTGKTFVLTNRVLRILLGGTSPEKILCLTFTKAAAAEMANRINERLAEWAVCDRQYLCEQIMQLTGSLPTEDQQDQARKLFARVLEVAGGLKIQTIHSFCQSLLGRFPLEAGIAPHFQVMDERTTLEHLWRAQDAVLGEARADINVQLAAALDHISRKLTETGFAELVRELIGQRSGLERMMRRYQTMEQVGSAMRRMLDLEESGNSGDIIRAACAKGSFDELGLRLAAEALLTGSSTNQVAGTKIADWLSSPEQRMEKFDRYKSAFLTAKGDIRKSLMPKKLAAACPAGLQAMEQEACRLLEVEDRLGRMTLLDNSLALLTLGTAMMAVFRDSKKRHAVMDYDDLILKVTGLIGTASIADWILYKLDGGIDHILIDEAQDTNPEQWQVIKALASEFFVGEGRSDQTRTIFAVGDVKQSIYSFQRADPKEFVDNRALFHRKTAAVRHHFHNVNLALSFRSTAAVLHLVDRVFAARESRIALSFSEEDIIHRPSRSGEAGLVELWPVVEDTEPIPDDDWAPPVIQQPARSPEMRLAVRIADRIADWIDRREQLPSRARPISPGDIMILVRRRTIFDHYMIRALKARNIPVAGQDKMLLGEQIAVMDLIAAGNFALMPDDDLTLAVMLKSPFIGFGEAALFELAHGRKGSLWPTLLSRAGEGDIFGKAGDFLTELTALADNIPPFEFYSRLLGPLGGREKLLARLGQEANDPIDEFLQLAMDYETGNISSLQGFLCWIEHDDVEIKRDMEQGQDQVRIMTVHAAKGLQAPVVILPDSCRMPQKGSRLLWAGPKRGAVEEDALLFWPGNKQYELGPCAEARQKITLTRDQEYLRLLYVALTRAEDRLYITGWQGRKQRDDACWYNLIQRTMETIDDVVTGDDDRDSFLLRLACPQDIPPEQKDGRTGHATLTDALPDWAKMMPPAEQVPARPLSPSRPAEEEPAVSSPLQAGADIALDRRRFNRGRLIHRLLEILPDLPDHERRAAARHYLGQSAHDLLPADIEQITGQVTALLADPDFAALFSPASRAEVSIVGLVGKTPVSGQVDRLVVTAREVLIIDYKTNRPPPDEVGRVPRLYLRQMAAYRALLSDVYPDRAVRCLLLWTDVSRLMELPADMLEAIIF